MMSFIIGFVVGAIITTIVISIIGIIYYQKEKAILKRKKMVRHARNAIKMMRERNNDGFKYGPDGLRMAGFY